MRELLRQAARPLLLFFGVITFLGVSGVILATFYPSLISNGLVGLSSLLASTGALTSTPSQQEIKQSVLAASQTSSLSGNVVFNIPAIFNSTAEFKKGLDITGSLLVNGKAINLNFPTYTPGAGISVGNGGSATISNLGVLSFQGQTGAVQLTAGDGVTIDGLTIKNSGVTSLQGQTGSITLSAGSGIGISGTTITNNDAGSSQHIFKNVTVGTNTITAGVNNDTLTLASGTGIDLTTSGNTITVSNSNGNMTQYWQSTAGVLSPLVITNDIAIGGISTASAKALFSGTTGNITTQGSLTVVGISNSSNETVAGTLGVSGITTLTSALIANGNVTLGTNNSNTITPNGVLAASLIPQSTSINLGSAGSPYGTVYTTNLIAGSSGTSGFWQLALGALSPVTSSNDLLVGGSSTVSAKFQVVGTTGNTSVGGTLGVIGNTTLSSLSTSATITDAGALSVGGTSTLTGNTSIGGTLGVTGNTALSSLSTSGNITDSGNETIAGTLGVTGTITGNNTILNGNVTLGSDNTKTITANGLFATSLIPTSSSVDLGSGAKPYGTLYVNNIVPSPGGGQSGYLQLNSGVLSPAFITNDLAVGGISTASSKFQVSGTTGNTTIAGTLGVTGASTFTGAITANAASTLNGNVTLGVDNTKTITPNGLFATSLIPQTTSVNLGSVSNPYGTLYVNNTIPSGSGGQNGYWQLGSGALSPANITNDLLIGGASSGSAKFQVSGTTGNTTIAGTLGVTGASTLTGNTTVGGTLGVTGLTSLANLNTSGNIADSGTLSVTSTSTLTGNTTVGGTLGVTGNTTLSSLSTTGNTTVGGTLGVTGNTSLTSLSTSGNITNSGNETIAGTLGVTGNTSLSTLSTSGNITNNANETIAGTLGVTGATTLSSTLSVTKNSGSTAVTFNNNGGGDTLDLYGSTGLVNRFDQYGNITATGVYNGGNSSFFCLGGCGSQTFQTGGTAVIGMYSATTPLATLDVRSVSGIQPIASLSGQTSSAGLVVDNSGTGDLFTASSSGLSRFTISQTGNVTIAGSQVNLTNSAGSTIGTAVQGYWTLGSNTFLYRRQVTITNNSSTQTLPINYNVTLTASGATATDLCANTLSNNNDLRTAYINAEINRNITRTCNTTVTIQIQLQAAIAPSGSHNNYFIYYGSPSIASSGLGFSPATNTQIDSMDSVGSWVSTDNTNFALSQETTIKNEGTGSLKGILTSQAGNVGTWSTTSQGQAPQLIDGQTSASTTIGGTTYIYMLGGFDGATYKSTVYKATIDGSGNIGSWATTNQSQLPQSIYQHSTAIITISGTSYIYTLGGTNGTIQSTVYKATIDGSGNIGSWATTAQGQLPLTLNGEAVITKLIGGTNYIYTLGGTTTGVGTRSTVYKATIDGSGNIGSWATTNQGQLPQALTSHGGVSVAIGGSNYVYTIGGIGAGFLSTVYNAQIDTSGNVGVWASTSQAQLPQAFDGNTAISAIIGGTTYVYTMGGVRAGLHLSTVYKAQVDPSGNVGAWTTTSQGQLPQTIQLHSTVTATIGGTTYAYTMAGVNNGTYQSTVYKTSIGAANYQATKTITSADWSSYNALSIQTYSSRTGSYMNFEFSNDGGTTWQSFPITVNSASTWETKTFDISGLGAGQKNTVTKYRINVTDSNVGFTAYYDDIEGLPFYFTDSAPTLAAASAANAATPNVNLGIAAQGATGTVNLNYSSIGSAGSGGITVYNGSTTKLFFVDGNGNTVIGSGTGALATNATNGFLYLPSSVGAPIGVPTSYTGNVATEYDTTNNKSCVYNGAWKCSGAYSDYAEWAPAKGASAGDLVSLTSEKNATEDATAPFMLGKSQISYDSKLIGVVSQYAENEQVANGYKKSADYHAIALAGRVPVKVSTINGPIHTGDMLTSSSIPGTAMKATKPGIIIGRATQDYLELDTTKVDTIIAFIQPGYADPSVILTADGNLSNAPTLATNIPITTTPLPGLSLQSGNASSSALPSLNNQVASLTNSVQTLQNQVASLSAQQVIASTSANLQTQVDTLTKAVNLLMISQLNGNPLGGTISSSAADTLTLTNAFTVTGKTTLSDVGITGTIQAGLLTIDGLNGTVNTLAGDLKLQATGLNGIDLENGKVTIDTNGNIITKGEVTVKKLNVTEDTATQSGTIGTAVIPSGQTTITIPTTAITDVSHVFTSPDSPLNFSLGITNKKAHQSFTVQIPSAQFQPISFSWWIVN